MIAVFAVPGPPTSSDDYAAPHSSFHCGRWSESACPRTVKNAVVCLRSRGSARSSKDWGAACPMVRPNAHLADAVHERHEVLVADRVQSRDD